MPPACKPSRNLRNLLGRKVRLSVYTGAVLHGELVVRPVEGTVNIADDTHLLVVGELGGETVAVEDLADLVVVE